MPAHFVYGLKVGKFVHVRDLDPAIERGRNCQCVCPECGGNLQAHMGNAKAWHFQHDIEDKNCNPQPMTLLHAFVRDRISEKRELWLPGASVVVTLNLLGRKWSEQVVIPDTVYAFSSGVKEMRHQGVQPDVVFSSSTYPDFAVEVRKTHAVDAAKKAALDGVFHNVVEFDVSDFPAEGITSQQLERALLDRRRWVWIHWLARRRAEFRLKDRIMWEQRDWRPDIGFFTKVHAFKPPASAKLRDAQKRIPWARGELERIRANQGTKMDKAAHLGQLSLTDRIAVVCAVVGLQPTELPVHFAQRIQLSMEHHPYSWQLPIFVAFGLRKKEFTSKDVEMWADKALPDCVLPYPNERTQNDFNRTRASIHSYLVQLESQGLLKSDENQMHGLRKFRAVFENWKDYMDFAEIE